MTEGADSCLSRMGFAPEQKNAAGERNHTPAAKRKLRKDRQVQ